MRKLQILSLIFLFGIAFCLTNGFADDNGIPVEGNFDFPTAEGPAYIQGNAEFQKSADYVLGTPDFEKMRDLPEQSRDYQLGTKVGWFIIPSRSNPDRYSVCTGFLVGPDLFMTNHHCIYDEIGLLPLEGAAILMDYYQEPDVDRTRGGVTARVAGILRMDAFKDYALLRLDRPIGNTYGWLNLDTTTRVNSTQSVKLISHPDARSKEIVRRNTQIIDIPVGHPLLRVPFALAYLADSEGGSSGSPVFLRDGTDVIGIHHSGWTRAGVPQFNAGSLMSYIVPEIQQWLPSRNVSDLVVDAPQVTSINLLPGESFTLSTTVRNQGGAAASPTILRAYQSVDSSITTADTQVGIAFIEALSPLVGAEAVNVTLSAPTALGTYYYGACVDAVDNESNINNNCSTGVRITVSTSPLVFSPRTIANQTYSVNMPITSLQLPMATGGTPPYTYTLAPIPAGLDFDAARRALSGTPTTVGSTTVIYTATDAASAYATLNFTIEVMDAAIPPPGDNPLDVNRDGQVTVIDLAIVALLYGTQVPASIGFPADVNADGIVNLSDLMAVARGIDAAGGTAGIHAISQAEMEAALVAAAEQAAGLEGIPEAPMQRHAQVSPKGVVYNNVATALAEAGHLGHSVPAVLEELLQRLTEMAAIPETSALLPNYPNPFNPETWIPYHLAQAANVTLTIYDVRGSTVRELRLGHQPAGVYESRGRAVYWDGKNQIGEKVASGLYFYTLTAGDFTATRKLLIAK